MSARSNSTATDNGGGRTQRKHLAELPAGGQIQLNSADEVDEWNKLAAGYIADFGLIRTNELAQLGAILAQQIAQNRAMQDMSDIKKAPAAVSIITKTSETIGELEKRLGIDRKSLQAGAKDDLGDYVKLLKKAGHARAVHITERTKAFEEFCMELRWKLRVLENADDEDKRHHGLSQESVCVWAAVQLAELEAKDKTWSHEKGKLFVGRL